MKLFFKGMSTFSTRAIYVIYVFFTLALLINYFSDTQKYNYVTLLLGVLLLSIVGSFILRKSSLYLEKLSEKNAFLF